jgi:hypothetical protein
MQDSFINSSAAAKPLDIKAPLLTTLDESMSSEVDKVVTNMSDLLT